MSKGYGSRERAILEMVDRHPDHWVRLTRGLTPSAAAAQRRAARRLASAGVIDLERRKKDGGSWLVARRHTEFRLPHDLDVMMTPSDRAALDKAMPLIKTSEQWKVYCDTYRRGLQERLWEAALSYGRNMDQLFEAMYRIACWEADGAQVNGINAVTGRPVAPPQR